MTEEEKKILGKLVVTEKEIIEGMEKELKEKSKDMVPDYRKVSDRLHRITWLFERLYERQKGINVKQAQEIMELKLKIVDLKKMPEVS